MLISDLPWPLAAVLAILWGLNGVLRRVERIYLIRKAHAKDMPAVARALNGPHTALGRRRSPDEDTMSG